MKIRLLFIALLAVPIGAALADQFQLKERKGSDVYESGYATVVITKDGAEVFRGQTDKIGRITVSLSPGTYTAQVATGGFNGAKKTVKLTLDGGTQLKVAFLN